MTRGRTFRRAIAEQAREAEKQTFLRHRKLMMFDIIQVPNGSFGLLL
jgi:hypothetical protein